MKKIISRIAIVLAGMFLALNANAQSSENPRRIWLVAHACNAHRWLQTAVQDGANGVEIDVNCADKIDPTATYVDFSVYHGHQGGYCDPAYRAKQNRGIKNPLDYYVSLEEYLKFEEMDNISILWLDAKCKNPVQVYHLVKEVHRILEDRYGSKELVPFSIIYGVYKMYTLRDNIGNTVMYPNVPLIDWLRDNLWENEGINLACEGPHGPYGTSETLEDLKKFFNGHNFPKGKHFASQGTGLPFMTFFNMKMVNTLVELKKMKEQGQYCVRTGAWSLGKAEYGLHMIPSKNDCPDKSYGTECDLVLMDGRSDFFPAKSLAPGYDCLAVQKFVQRFFRPTSADSYYYKYNRGHYVLAGNRWEDPFYK